MILTVKSRAVTRALEQYHAMPPVPEDDQPATFGPKRHRGVNYVWHYRGGNAWEVEQVEDETLADYAELRGPVIELAQEHLGKMPRGGLVQLLIQAAISGGITDRAGILDTVQLATNLDAAVDRRQPRRRVYPYRVRRQIHRRRAGPAPRGPCRPASMVGGRQEVLPPALKSKHHARADRGSAARCVLRRAFVGNTADTVCAL